MAHRGGRPVLLSRRDVLRAGVFTGAALALPLQRWASGQSSTSRRIGETKLPAPFSVPFVRPPVSTPVRTAGGVEYHRIVMAPMQAEVLPGYLTTLYAYNGSVPGPTIRATRGTPIVARFVNRLPPVHATLKYEPYTSVHLHGGASLPQYDGYASDITRPGQYKDYRWDNNERSRTLWYHDHAFHHTAQNVYMGLAAQYHLLDPNDATLGLPTGDYDVPLIIGDAMFERSGELLFSLENEKGLWGDVVLVNGRPWPVMRVARRKYRFRMLNACVSRSFHWFLDSGDDVTVIGTDAGLMPAPVRTKRIRHTNGERYDVVIDFAAYPAGTRIAMRNASLKYNDDYTNTDKIMMFEVVDDAFDPSNNSVPELLAPDNPVMTTPVSRSVRTRTFRTKRQGGEWTVNGNTWQDVIDSGFRFTEARPVHGTTEIWEYQNNSGGWAHPMHAHLLDVRILTRNGKPPYPYEVGPKDTINVGENETVRVLATFDGRGKYMIHCHNTMHEDHDMMTQFEVIDPARAAPDPFSAPALPLPELPL
jgi:FtsP/CotA-like multicopper oxidase with cupredoxin domain